MDERDRLQEAIVLLSAQRSRLGRAAVETIVSVLDERLAALPAGSPRPAEARAEEQRKQVTILFAAVEGFTRLVGAAHNTARLRQIDLLWRQVDETIHAHGGIVDKHMGDVIMGIFGVPAARENDPERAVRCALAVRQIVGEALAALASGNDRADDEPAPIIRIGINTGLAALGQVGSDDGPTVIGDTVNVASRLKDAGPGVTIGQDTYRLVRELFRVEPLGPVAVKGRRMPVTAYRVVGTQPRPFFPGGEGVEGVTVPLIGRRLEMAALEKALRETAQSGRGRLITLMGEAGVGKSRLAREFSHRLDTFPAKATRLQGRSDQSRTQVPYGLLRDVALDHFGIEEGDRGEVVAEKVRRRWAEVWPDGAAEAEAVARLLGPAGESDEEEGHGGRTVSSSSVSLRSSPTTSAAEALRDYFIALARRSAVTVLFLEDIHWADDDSLAVVERLAEAAAGAPLLILSLARPLLLENRPRWASLGLRLPLEPLGEADSRELVLQLLRKLPEIPLSLSDLIVRSAAGNPFYVEELVRVLIEDGVIVPGEEEWRLRPRELTRLRVPTTLTGVLQARLDRLPELERVTLQQAAVIGDEFWAGAVQQLNAVARTPFSPEQVAAALGSLERRDMVYRTRPALGDQAYLFKHAVLREVAYESVLLRDRPGYHLGAARWLAARGDDQAAEFAAPIARHYEAAGQAAEAARLYEQAAVQAEAQYKPDAAVGLYRRALELLKGLPHLPEARLNVQDRLGRALQQGARLVEALYTYHAMQRLAELDGNLAGQARAENSIAGVLYELGDFADALAAAERAEQLARLGGSEVERVRALRRRGEASYELRIRNYELGMEEAHAKTQRRQEENSGLADFASLRAGSSVAYLEEAVTRSRAVDAPRELAWSLSLLGMMSGVEAAEAATAELAALAEALEARGVLDEAATTRTLLGRALVARGEATAAVEPLNLALARQRAAGDLGGAAESLRLLGVAALQEDDEEDPHAKIAKRSKEDSSLRSLPTWRSWPEVSAVDYLEEAVALAEAAGDRYLRLRSRLALGEALRRAGRPEAAEAILRAVIATAEDPQRMGTWRRLPEARALLERVLREQGRGDEIRMKDEG